METDNTNGNMHDAKESPKSDDLDQYLSFLSSLPRSNTPKSEPEPVQEKKTVASWDNPQSDPSDDPHAFLGRLPDIRPANKQPAEDAALEVAKKTVEGEPEKAVADKADFEPVNELQGENINLLDEHLSFISSLQKTTEANAEPKRASQEPVSKSASEKKASSTAAPKATPKKKRTSPATKKKSHAKAQREEKDRIEKERAQAKKAEMMKQHQEAKKEKVEQPEAVDHSPLIKKAFSFIGRNKGTKKK